MKSTSSELQIDGRPAILRSTATRTIGSLGAQEIIPNEGATKTALLAKAWLYFRGDSQDTEIGIGTNSGVVGDPGSGHVGLESLEFINNNQAIAPRINESLSGFDAFTIGCWVRFNSFNYAGPWASWNSASAAQGQLVLYNNGGTTPTLPEFGVAYGSNFYTVTAKNNSWKVNYWHYCLCEVDKTNLKIKLWIDNKLQGETTLPSGFTLNTGVENFGLGGYNQWDNTISNMSGNIEEFVIFDDVLTSTERDWLWNKSYGNTLQETPEPPTVTILPTGWGTQQTGTNTLVYAPDGFLDVCLASGMRMNSHKHTGRISRGSPVSISGNGSTKYLYSLSEYNVGHIFDSNSTVECWFRPTSIKSSLCPIFGRGDDLGNSATSTFYVAHSTSLLYLGGGNGSAIYDVSNGTILIANIWHHVALVRYNNKLYLYINGTLQLVTATIGNLYNNSDRGVFFSGAPFAEASGLLTTRCADGYYEQIRISNIARYTANFTPETSFTVD